MDHDWVGFDDNITCAGGDIPIVGMFTRGLIIGTFTIFLVREGNERFPLHFLYNIPGMPLFERTAKCIGF